MRSPGAAMVRRRLARLGFVLPSTWLFGAGRRRRLGRTVVAIVDCLCLSAAGLSVVLLCYLLQSFPSVDNDDEPCRCTGDMQKVCPCISAADSPEPSSSTLAERIAKSTGGDRKAVHDSIAKTPADLGMTLRHVQVFFRHGARTPLKHVAGFDDGDYNLELFDGTASCDAVPVAVRSLDGGPRPVSTKDEQYKNLTFRGGARAGQLTALGRLQALSLGRNLRLRYVNKAHLIGSEYDSNDIYVRATNRQRCLETAQCVLAGMYEKSLGKATTVVVHTATDEQEMLYPNTKMCRFLKEMRANIPGLLAAIPDYRAVESAFYEHVGHGANRRLDVMQLRDHIVMRLAHGLPVDPFFLAMSEAIDREAVRVIKMEMCGVEAEQRMILPLSAGPLLKMIRENLDAAMQDPPPSTRIRLYSSQDATLVTLLVAIGCYDEQWPPYVGELAFELYEDTNHNHWVQILYGGQRLTLQGLTGPLMTVKEFFDVADRFRPIDGECDRTI